MLRPIIHFFALGALAFAAVQWAGTSGRADPAAAPRLDLEPVVVDEVRRAQLAADWRARFGADPSVTEMQRLVAHALDDEILFREALRLGLHEHDPVVRQRLVQNMRFLSNAPMDESADAGESQSPNDDRASGVAPDAATEAEWIARAEALDMHRNDLVVRRRLVQRMQAAIDAGAQAPSHEETLRFVESNSDLFRSAGRARVAYAFGSDPGDGELAFGGTFTEGELEALFGRGFLAQLATLTPGVVTGPWAGPHGEAWVRVAEAIPPVPHPFEYVEDRAREMLFVESRERVRRETMQSLRVRHRVSPDALAEGARGAAASEVDG